MMKLLSFAAIAGVASAAEEKMPPAATATTTTTTTTASTSTRRHRSYGPTKETPESSARRFARDNLRRKSRTTARAPPPVDDVGRYAAPGKRALRSVSDREGRRGKAVKREEGGIEDDDDGDDDDRGHGHDDDDDEYGHDDDDHGHDHGHGHDDDHDDAHAEDDDSHGHGSDSKNGKRGKSGKSAKGAKSRGKSSGDGREDGHEELFYLLPTACPNECITSIVTGDAFEFADSVRRCKANDESHMWLVRSDGSYVKIESAYDRGMCIGVDYRRGDAAPMLAETCYDGELVLKECDSDYGTEWYFTGGQLINSMCWGAGLSSSMTVFFDDDSKDKDVVKECQKDVAVWGANDEAVLKADTFMFVNRLPEAPFVIQDLEDAIKEKEPKTKNSDDNKKMGAIYMNEVDDSIDVEGST